MVCQGLTYLHFYTSRVPFLHTLTLAATRRQTLHIDFWYLKQAFVTYNLINLRMN